MRRESKEPGVNNNRVMLSLSGWPFNQSGIYVEIIEKCGCWFSQYLIVDHLQEKQGCWPLMWKQYSCDGCTNNAAGREENPFQKMKMRLWRWCGVCPLVRKTIATGVEITSWGRPITHFVCQTFHNHHTDLWDRDWESDTGNHASLKKENQMHPHFFQVRNSVLWTALSLGDPPQVRTSVPISCFWECTKTNVCDFLVD
jgi:hypothetical protein